MTTTRCADCGRLVSDGEKHHLRALDFREDAKRTIYLCKPCHLKRHNTAKHDAYKISAGLDAGFRRAIER